MEVVLLGTGTLRPEPDKGSASLAVVEGPHVLPIDLGRNCLSRMVECGIDPMSIPRFLVTHLHPDHTCELVSLLFALKHGREGDAPVRLVGPSGLDRLTRRLIDAWEWLEPTYPLEVVEIGPGPVPCDDFDVEAMRMEHGNTEDLGYRVRSPRTGEVVAFTGDTGPCDALVELGRGVDVLVSECASTDAGATPFHMSPTALGQAASAAGAGHLVITHLYPETPPDEVLRDVRRHFGGPVTIGTDRLRVPARPL